MVKTNPIPINAKTIIQPVEKFCNLPNILPSISTDAHFYTYDRFLLISSGSIDRTNLYEGHLETSEQQSTNITNFENLKKIPILSILLLVLSFKSILSTFLFKKT